MSQALDRRHAAFMGLALAAVMTLWWLVSSRLALDRGSDASRSAVQVLDAAALVRALVLGLIGVRVGTLRGWRGGTAVTLATIVPWWPVAVLAWSASPLPWPRAALPELALLGCGATLPLLGAWLRRALPAADLADLAGSTVGCAFAASVWFGHGVWLAAP